MEIKSLEEGRRQFHCSLSYMLGSGDREGVAPQSMWTSDENAEAGAFEPHPKRSTGRKWEC